MKKLLGVALLLLVCFVFMSYWFYIESIGLVDQYPERLTKAWLVHEDEIVTESEFSESERIRLISLESRYYKMKYSAWNIDQLLVDKNGNSQIFIENASEMDFSKIFQYTYWDISLLDISNNFQKYVGENIYFDYCTITGYALIQKNTDLSRNISDNNEFYIVSFEDEEGNKGSLYLLSDFGKSLLPLYEFREERSVMISGWPLGVDGDGNVVLAY